MRIAHPDIRRDIRSPLRTPARWCLRGVIHWSYGPRICNKKEIREMIVLFNILLWGTILAAGAVAWLLLWEDAKDRRRGLRAQHDAKWQCACACPGLNGYHSHWRCVFND